MPASEEFGDQQVDYDDDDEDDHDYYDQDDQDDIYIMMQCLFVCHEK